MSSAFKKKLSDEYSYVSVFIVFIIKGVRVVRRILFLSVLVLGVTILFGQSRCISQSRSSDYVPGAVYKNGPVIGKMVDAGFIYGDSNYHAIIQASDGNVYYVICSHNTKSGAHMFRCNSRTGEVITISDLTVEVSEDRNKTVNQGKVHSDMYEVDRKLYLGTHAGTYEDNNLMRYPGGHYMSYDLKITCLRFK